MREHMIRKRLSKTKRSEIASASHGDAGYHGFHPRRYPRTSAIPSLLNSEHTFRPWEHGSGMHFAKKSVAI
jgi:hypothetical protein